MERVKLEMLEDNPYNVRVEYGDLSDLTESFLALAAVLPETSGLLQVPLARRVDGRVQLALGHRRRRAFEMLARPGDARFATLPVHLADLDDAAMADIAWTENEKRRDISDIERALAIEIAQRDFGWTQAAVGQRWGMTQGTVSNLLRLLKLPDNVGGLIRRGEISGRHGRALLPLVELGARWEAYLDALQDGAPGKWRSVAEVEREVARFVGATTTGLASMEWAATWDPQLDGARACEGCAERIMVGREWRCKNFGCFNLKRRHYHIQVEGPRIAAGVYAAHTGWQWVANPGFARCAGCGREINRITAAGEWLKSGWYAICPDCARRADLRPAPAAETPQSPPIYVNAERRGAAPVHDVAPAPAQSSTPAPSPTPSPSPVPAAQPVYVKAARPAAHRSTPAFVIWTQVEPHADQVRLTWGVEGGAMSDEIYTGDLTEAGELFEQVLENILTQWEEAGDDAE